MKAWKWSVLALACVLLVAGCGAKPASLEIQPGSVILKSAGATHNLTATVKDAKGQALEKFEPVVWQSSDESVATVSSTGVVKAVSSGTANVTGMTGTITASIEVVVKIVASVAVHPGQANINVTESKDFDAIVHDDKGNVITGEKVKWSVGDASIATVSENGTVTGTGKGTTSVRASVESVSGKASVTVLPKEDLTPAIKAGAEEKKLDKGKDKDKDSDKKSSLKPSLKKDVKDKKLKK